MNEIKKNIDSIVVHFLCGTATKGTIDTSAALLLLYVQSYSPASPHLYARPSTLSRSRV